MKKFLIILFTIFSIPAWAEEKVLSIDDFIGVARYESNNEIYCSISKENDIIKIYDSTTFPKLVTCKLDKTTSKRIYLDCYNPNARYDFFKYPYIKIHPRPYDIELEIYTNSFERTAKENYYKYNCDKEEDKDYYTIECKESNWGIKLKKE